MRKTKLFRILVTMSDTELLHFKEFVSTPYFNTNKNVIKLFDYIYPYAPTFEDEKLNDEDAHTFIFPRVKYIPSKRVITKLSSKLLNLLSQYISVESHLKNDFQSKFNLLLHFRDHKLMDDFHSLSKKIQKDHASLKNNPNVFYNDFLIEREVNRIMTRTTDTGVGDLNFQNASEALDIYFIYTKLIYVCQKLNRGQVVMGTKNPKYLVEILDSLPDTPYIDIPQINIWHKAYKLLSSTDSNEKLELYAYMKQQLIQDNIELEKDQIRVLFAYLENVAIRHISSEKRYQELYELYAFQNKLKVLLNDKTAVPHLIKNFVSVLIMLNKYDEAEEFLISNQSDILPLFKQQYLFCQALILFEKKDYEKTIDTLNELSLKNIYLKINEKRLRIKIHYHLGYHELVQDNINSFRVFLTNNKDDIHEFHINGNRNFINAFSKICKLNGTNPSNLSKEIEDTKEIAEKKWLISLLQ